MQRKRLAALVGVVTVVLFGAAAPAWAVDYPPSTAKVAGEAVTKAVPSDGGHALPFTGGNSMALVWIALALIAAGAFLVTRKRRTAVE